MYVYLSWRAPCCSVVIFIWAKNRFGDQFRFLIEEPEIAGTAPTATSLYTVHNVSKKYQQFQAEDH